MWKVYKNGNTAQQSFNRAQFYTMIEILQKGSNMSTTPVHESDNISTTLHEVYHEMNDN
jgi:hypothetical protein